MNRQAMCERFVLKNGQFFAYYRYKNLQWELNGEFFGYGDLRDDDLIRIQEELSEYETFKGWNEHHGTEWQQTDIPMVVITHDDIKFREEIFQEDKERRVGVPCQDPKCTIKWGHNHKKEESK